jgi:hypothetical protein
LSICGRAGFFTTANVGRAAASSRPKQNVEKRERISIL